MKKVRIAILGLGNVGSEYGRYLTKIEKKLA